MANRDNDDDDDDGEGRFRWFNEWLLPCAGTGLERLADDIRGEVERRETRTRARKAKDAAAFIKLVRCVVANLAIRAFDDETGEPCPLGVRFVNGRTKQSRYQNPVFGQQWNRLADDLVGLGLIERQSGRWRGDNRRSDAALIVPTSAFVARLDGLGAADFMTCVDRERETIVLNGKTRRGGLTDHAKNLDYDDTPLSAALRAEMRDVNAYLSGIDLGEIDPDTGRIWPIQPSDRFLYRAFNIGEVDAIPEQPVQTDFRFGGRLFGGKWQKMRKADRWHLRIGGEPIVEVDFKSMGPRLAYAMAGVEPPPGDIYALPGCEAYRADVKRVFSAWLNGHRLIRWPKELIAASKTLGRPAGPNADGQFPEGTIVRSGLPATSILLALRDRHRPIAGLCGPEFGHRCFRMESDILLEVLKRLKDRGILALPIHDAIVIGASAADEAKEVMEAVSSTISGITIPAEIKAMEGPIADQGLDHNESPSLRA